MESAWLAAGLRAVDPERPLAVVRVLSDGPGHELWSAGLPRQLATASRQIRRLMPVLEQWVERGIAPERVVASHSTDGKVDRTRPLCPHPQVARYSGTGSIDEAANFRCVAP